MRVYPPARAAFTLLEILMAVAILAMCFIPILTQSHATITETEESQESLLARHVLIDLVERFRGSPIGELQLLPAAPPASGIPLGGPEHHSIANDPMLNDVKQIADEMAQQAAASSGAFVDAGSKGTKSFVNLQSMMKVTREVYYQQGSQMPDGGVLVANSPYQGTLTCIVRWQPRNGKAEKSISLKKVMVVGIDPP